MSYLYFWDPDELRWKLSAANPPEGFSDINKAHASFNDLYNPNDWLVYLLTEESNPRLIPPLKIQ